MLARKENKKKICQKTIKVLGLKKKSETRLNKQVKYHKDLNSGCFAIEEAYIHKRIGNETMNKFESDFRYGSTFHVLYDVIESKGRRIIKKKVKKSQSRTRVCEKKVVVCVHEENKTECYD